MRHRHNAGGHRGCRAGRRTTGGVVSIPGVAGDVYVGVFGRAAHAELGCGGATQQIEPGAAHLPGEESVGFGAPALHEARAHLLQASRQRRAKILHQEGHTGKRTIRVKAVDQRIIYQIVEYLDHRIKRRIDERRAGRGLLREFGGRQLTASDPLGQRAGIMVGPFGPVHRQGHAVLHTSVSCQVCVPTIMRAARQA